MHNSSYEAMMSYIERFNKGDRLKVLDVGSYSFGGLTYRHLMSSNWEYTGLDIVEGPNVDVIVDEKNPFRYPFEDKTFDIIISGQCMEHITEIWTWMKELYRVAKIGGGICIIAPSSGKEHTEHDYWRIMPQGMRLLMEWAGFENVVVSINPTGKWNDVVGIGRRKLYSN